MELYKALNIRKSIRSYTGEGITDAQLERILTAAYEAPIGMKRYEDAGSDQLIHALYELIGDGNAFRQLKMDTSYDHFIRILQSVLSVQSETEDDFFR